MDLKNNTITLGEILKNEKAGVIIKEEFGDLMKGPLFGMAKKMSLAKILEFAKGKVDENKINEILNKLKNA